MVWSGKYSFGFGKITTILGKYSNKVMKTLGRYKNKNITPKRYKNKYKNNEETE